MKKRALLSVSDKRGVAEFAQGLIELGYEVLSTGGTAKTLEENGIKVTSVSEVTGFPEILEGRVKTLHPKIHGGILARRTAGHLAELKQERILPIDLVAVNLYPFAAAVAKKGASYRDAIENIDIGGPAMIRAAAKNHEYVTVLVSPDRYEEVLNEIKKKGEVSPELRRQLALEAFRHTASYDLLISQYLDKTFTGMHTGTYFPDVFLLQGEKLQDLRYGENPHQAAAFYRTADEGLGAIRQVQGKELSFNNLIDLNAAWSLIREFEEPACAVIKHANPCGVAVSCGAAEACRKALSADPVSAFGGIVALNKEVDQKTAEILAGLFLEIVAAPGFNSEALTILKTKPRMRILEIPDCLENTTLDLKRIDGGFLIQTKDETKRDEWTWATEAGADIKTLADLKFAWTVVKHVKSNAIVCVKDGMTMGIGAGQTSRVGAAKIALEQAGEKIKGGVLASDAFLPFRDTVDLAAQFGIKAIIQPGGSIKDNESVAACNQHDIAMAFTGIRHFKH